MESIPTQSTPPRPRFLRAVVAALLMSVITLLIWFLTSENVSTIGLAILITTVILTLLNWLIWTLTRNAKRGGKAALRIVAAIASLIILLSATMSERNTIVKIRKGAATNSVQIAEILARDFL